MVEVFKTDVKCKEHALKLLQQIHGISADYKANFDLEDCDNILRVQSSKEIIHAPQLINLLKDHGFNAEVLPD